VALDWDISETTLLSLTDTLTIDADLSDQIVDDELLNSRLFTNDLGLQLESEITRWIQLSLRAGREDVRSLDSAFDYRDRVGYLLGGELMWQANRRTKVGPYFAWRTYEHLQDQRNDAVDMEIGGRLREQLSPTTSLDLTVGWQQLDFSLDNSPAITDEKGHGVAWSVSVSNRPRRNVSHSVSLKSYQRLGTSVAFNGSEDFTAGYRFDWDLNLRWHLTFLSRYIESQRLEDLSADEEQWSNEISLRYQYRRYSMHAGYRNSRRWSDFSDRDYETNEWSIGIGYDF
jgi:hypothetical protein